jgi:hypothetical protein
MGLPIRSNGSAAPYATSGVIKGTSKVDQGGIKGTTNNRGRASHGADGVLMGIPMSDRSKIDRYLPWSLIAPCTQILKRRSAAPPRKACLHRIWGFRVGLDNVFLDAPFVKPHLTGKNESVEGEDGPRKRDTGVPVFWAAESLLKDLGLLEFVGHVVESDTAEGEPIHPYAIGNGEEIERRLANAAKKAAESMLTEEERDWARNHGLVLVPVLRHLSAVQMIGIARLRYRPRTKATAAWFAERQGLSGWVSRYEAMAAPRHMQHQG